MKTRTYMCAVFSICLFLAGCISVGEMPIDSGTRADLNQANFRVVKTSACY